MAKLLANRSAFARGAGDRAAARRRPFRGVMAPGVTPMISAAFRVRGGAQRECRNATVWSCTSRLLKDVDGALSYRRRA